MESKENRRTRLNLFLIRTQDRYWENGIISLSNHSLGFIGVVLLVVIPESSAQAFQLKSWVLPVHRSVKFWFTRSLEMCLNVSPNYVVIPEAVWKARSHWNFTSNAHHDSGGLMPKAYRTVLTTQKRTQILVMPCRTDGTALVFIGIHNNFRRSKTVISVNVS